MSKHYRRGRPPTQPFWPSTTTANCGSRAGYKRHRREGEEACGPCKKAHAAYSRDYRTDGGEPMLKYRTEARVKARAMRKLARRYPDEFRALLIAEKKAEDLAMNVTDEERSAAEANEAAAAAALLDEELTQWRSTCESGFSFTAPDGTDDPSPTPTARTFVMPNLKDLLT